MTVKPSATAPGGFVVFSHAGDDINLCRDHVHARLGDAPWKPGRANGRALHDEIEAMLSGDAAPRASAVPLRFVCSYDYCDRAGKVAYQVRRFDPKTFRQRRPDGNGGWIDNLDGVTRVPYRLPELRSELAMFPLAAVYITEGEKDCDNVRRLPLIATCAAGSVWTPDMAKILAGRFVFILADNDEPGRKKAEAAALVLSGIAASVRIASFPELPDKGDVSDWLNIPGNGSSDALIDHCHDAPAFEPAAEPVAPPADKAPPLPFVDISTWRIDHGVPARDWGVRDLFPRRNVALLSGEGAAGKSLLLLQLGIAHCLARDWIGNMPEPGPFLYLSAEDDADEVHRRMADILRSYGADFPELQGNFHLLTFAGLDAVLGSPDSAGLIKPTPLFNRLIAAANEIRPILIGIDTSADVYAGNENDRAQVRQFVGMLRGMAMQANAYVIVNSHPSLTGMNSGSGLSGSTGWHNSVRARAYLTTVKTGKDEEPDPLLRTLEFKKSNYGPIARSIALRWHEGVYRPVASVTGMDKAAKEQTVDRVFLALLTRFNRQSRNTSHKPAAKNYAPYLFAREIEATGAGIKEPDLCAALRRLFKAEEIAVEPYGPPSKEATRLIKK